MSPIPEPPSSQPNCCLQSLRNLCYYLRADPWFQTQSFHISRGSGFAWLCPRKEPQSLASFEARGVIKHVHYDTNRKTLILVVDTGASGRVRCRRDGHMLSGIALSRYAVSWAEWVLGQTVTSDDEKMVVIPPAGDSEEMCFEVQAEMREPTPPGPGEDEDEHWDVPDLMDFEGMVYDSRLYGFLLEREVNVAFTMLASAEGNRCRFARRMVELRFES